MEYEAVIIGVLMEAGDKGLSISKISRHVLNQMNTLFEQMTYEQVHKEVSLYIQKNSRNSYSTFERTSKRGCYRLNRNSEKFSQLKLEF